VREVTTSNKKMSTEMKVDLESIFEDMTPPQFIHAARKQVSRTKSDPVKARATLTLLLDWVEENPIRFGPESAMGKLVDLIMKFDDDDDVDDNDVSTFMSLIGEFFKKITAKDIAETENWEMSSNMSPNLLLLFGKPVAPRKDNNSGWNAPDKAGMSNSNAVVPTEKNAYKEEARAARVQPPAESKSQEPAPAKIEKMKSDDDEEEEEEDDDDDDEDYDDEEEEEDRPPIAMSLNLMKALGLDTTGMEEVVLDDWKPPDKIGIEANPDSWKMDH